MTDVEFRNWLSDEVSGGRMTATQRDELLSQKAIFDFNRNSITQSHPNEVVGYVGNVQVSAKTVHELLNQTRQIFPGKIVYFEPVGFNLF